MMYTEEEKNQHSLVKDPNIPDEQGYLSPASKAMEQHEIQTSEKSNG